ncbi:O-methyltransferase [Lentzea sp. NBRC 105346]|uniref:O-methyltransferase n=1 Tax=Lentzea sp. NBRC 105346 TaxID=3032205 RepID=UPI0024A07B8E|nr:class I SAM-dependent methyltransferase [Lentzea sp. NBRC 105346]GLZ27947.1 O-methyltransferase [Lentzea sp. NBRC 105346]
MAGQIELTPNLLDYVDSVSLREDSVLERLRIETAGIPLGKAMQVMPGQGQLLAFLVRLTAAREVLEIGTFTGYSTLCIASALPADGKVVTCDITARWLSVAEPYWAEAGVRDRIDFRQGDATTMLATMPVEGFDIVFVDADKSSYGHYLEESLRLVRTGGLIILDNTLLSGRVVDADANDADTETIRKVNAQLRNDERVDLVLLPIADGVTLLRKR